MNSPRPSEPASPWCRLWHHVVRTAAMAAASLLVAGCGKSPTGNPTAPAAPWQIKSVQALREGQHLQVQVTVEATNTTAAPLIFPPKDAALLRPDGTAVPNFRRPFLPQPTTLGPAEKGTVVLRYSLLEADLAGELSLRWGGVKQPLGATPKPVAAFAEGKWENW